MDQHLERFEPQKLKILYKALFFITIGTALVVYVQSSFLKDLIGEARIGIFFSLASLFTLGSVLVLPGIILKVGKRKTIVALFGLVALSLALMGVGGTSAQLLAFLLYNIFLTLLWITLDIFIETFSKDASTGRIRGFAYTSMNVAWVLTPALAGGMASTFNFSFLFLLAAIIILPFTLVFLKKFRQEPDNFNHPPPIPTIIKNIFRSPALSKVFFVSFLLTFFYAWMVIYVPLHLRNLGFEWWEIGRIFSVMLLPFLLLQYPAGWMADRFLGEKELMTAGILILSASTASLFWLTSTEALPWMLLLFLTRVGAAIIEIMRDSYFYKQIDLRDIHFISFFRNTGPLAYFIAPLVATVILNFLPLPTLFLVLSGIVLTGLTASLTLKDTR